MFAEWLRPRRVLPAAVVVAAGVLACRETTTPKAFSKAAPTGASQTVGVGFTSTVAARGNLGAFHIQSKVGGFDVELKTHDNADIAVANIKIAVDGSSGWHYHPGPALVVVTSGAITFYRADDPNCAGTRYPAGTSFAEKGGGVGNAVNKEGVEATSVAVFFAPPAPSPLRIDAPKPKNCA